MSTYIEGLVWRCYPGEGTEFTVALALADHAHDDGTHIFPSVSALALKTRQSESSVQRHLRRMREVGWLITVAGERGGRGVTRQYKINPDWIRRAQVAIAGEKRKKSVKLTPFSPELTSDDRTSAARTGAPGEPHDEQDDVAPPREDCSAGIALSASNAPRQAVMAASGKGCQFDTLSRDEKGVTGARKGCQHDPKRVSPVNEKGVTAMTPESSGIVMGGEASGIITPERVSVTSENAHDVRLSLEGEYPDRGGPMDWETAQHHIARRLAEGQTGKSLRARTREYRTWCELTEKIGTQYVHDPAHFYAGPRGPWSREWKLPMTPAERRERRALEQLIARRAAIGLPDFRLPDAGESSDAYRAAQEEACRARDRTRPPDRVRELLAPVVARLPTSARKGRA